MKKCIKITRTIGVGEQEQVPVDRALVGTFYFAALGGICLAISVYLTFG